MTFLEGLFQKHCLCDSFSPSSSTSILNMTGRVILVKPHVSPLLGNLPWLPGTLSENQCSSFSMTYETLSDLDPHPLLQLCHYSLALTFLPNRLTYISWYLVYRPLHTPLALPGGPSPVTDHLPLTHASDQELPSSLKAFPAPFSLGQGPAL